MFGDFGLLIFYFTLAIAVSFLCSILEAVLLSITPQYIALVVKQDQEKGNVLKSLKADIDKPLTAILTVNTIAHTMGAAGVGAQITRLYGNQYLAIGSILMTLAVLFFSEIIPKTIGTYYWRFYASFTAKTLYYLTALLAPFIKLSQFFTRMIIKKKNSSAVKLEEFNALSQLAIEQGILLQNQSEILQNLLDINAVKIRKIMTPRTVLFSMSKLSTVEEYITLSHDNKFSRVPLYNESVDDISGFALRSELLLAHAANRGTSHLAEYTRNIEMVLENSSVLAVLSRMIAEKLHIMVVINEYGETLGLVTLEDLLEYLIGSEIVDEQDSHVDMQKVAMEKNNYEQQ